MRKTDENEILKDLYGEADGDNEPSLANVLSVTRAELARRKKRHQFIGTAAAAIALSGAVWLTSLQDEPAQRTPGGSVVRPDNASTQPKLPENPTMIDEKQMFAMVGDTPAALVEYPDGRKSLLVLVERKHVAGGPPTRRALRSASPRP